MAEEYDPVIDDIRETLREISTEMTEARANYERACMDGDDVARRAALRQLGAYQTEYNNAVNYGNQYWQSQHPPASPQPSKEQRDAKRWHEMNYADVWDMASKSKYGVDEAAFREGMAEVARRRARGE